MQDLNRRDLVMQNLRCGGGLHCAPLGVWEVTYLVTAPLAPIKIGLVSVSFAWWGLQYICSPPRFPLSCRSLKFCLLSTPASPAPNACQPQAGCEFVVWRMARL